MRGDNLNTENTFFKIQQQNILMADTLSTNMVSYKKDNHTLMEENTIILLRFWYKTEKNATCACENDN